MGYKMKRYQAFAIVIAALVGCSYVGSSSAMSLTCENDNIVINDQYVTVNNNQYELLRTINTPIYIESVYSNGNQLVRIQYDSNGVMIFNNNIAKQCF